MLKYSTEKVDPSHIPCDRMYVSVSGTIEKGNVK